MDYLFYYLHIYRNQPWKLLFWLTSSFFYDWLKMIELEPELELERSGLVHA
jgi:hypothetical protein